MQKTLLKYGIEARIERPDIKLTQRSCAYAVVVSEGFLPEALDILSKNRLVPVRAFIRDETGGYREISI